MLFKQKDLQGIKEGKISLAFRKWKNPRVKKGTLLKTPIGQIEIKDIFVIKEDQITAHDVLNSGFADISTLLKILNKRQDGQVYKIQLAYHSPDPRIQLRNQTNITTSEWATIKKRLENFDTRSNAGPWTLEVLRIIQENPLLRAKDLAQKMQRPKDWFKINVRKLKNMGLTISHPTGYEISPRGQKVIQLLEAT